MKNFELNIQNVRFRYMGKHLGNKVTKYEGGENPLPNQADEIKFIAALLITRMQVATTDNEGERIFRPSAKVDEGSKVEARFGDGMKWLAGEVTRVHSNGTYDIQYKDTEQGVARELMRMVVDTKIQTIDNIPKGSIVKARFGGGKEWLSGEVTRVHSNGTYDIKYKHADRCVARELPKELVRMVVNKQILIEGVRCKHLHDYHTKERILKRKIKTAPGKLPCGCPKECDGSSCPTEEELNSRLAKCGCASPDHALAACSIFIGSPAQVPAWIMRTCGDDAPPWKYCEYDVACDGVSGVQTYTTFSVSRMLFTSLRLTMAVRG